MLKRANGAKNHRVHDSQGGGGKGVGGRAVDASSRLAARTRGFTSGKKGLAGQGGDLHNPRVRERDNDTLSPLAGRGEGFVTGGARHVRGEDHGPQDPPRRRPEQKKNLCQGREKRPGHRNGS